MKNKSKTKITLKYWIDENFNLLALLGIFGAIVAFFNQAFITTENMILSYITLISFIIFLIICVEVWVSFPQRDKNVSHRLTVFELLFYSFMVFISIYIWTTYKSIILNFIWIILLPIYGFGGIKLMEKIKLYKLIRKTRLGKKENIISHIFAILFVGLVLILSFKTQELILYIIG